MSNIFIQPFQRNDFNSFFEFAVSNNHNLEIATFADSDELDTSWKSTSAVFRKKLYDFNGQISIHGPFLDLMVHSRDKKISEIARKRIYTCLKIAKKLKAHYIILHANFNPLIRHDAYEKHWLRTNYEFYDNILYDYDLTVLLENVWEPRPDIFRKLLDRVKNPDLKICFDVGHANIFSSVPLENWFSVLKNDIAYIHINDNLGDTDSELIPGEGNINWNEFSDLMLSLDIPPKIVFEVGSLENTQKALAFFKENKIYPFN